MMKNILKLLLCVCITFCIAPDLLKAQNRAPLNLPFYDDEPYHYGFILGYNQMLFSINYIDDFQNVIHPSTELPSNDILPGTTDEFKGL